MSVILIFPMGFFAGTFFLFALIQDSYRDVVSLLLSGFTVFFLVLFLSSTLNHVQQGLLGVVVFFFTTMLVEVPAAIIRKKESRR